MAGDTKCKTKSENKWITPIRVNVLALLVIAYGSIIGLFAILVGAGVDPKTAYDLIGVPFVALIGGTLAVAKDLIG
ncbi:MAG: hypothetical protein OXU26_01605 [Acidobacteriota bacterium]|nr:hypothetical protein [Chloroflexota bacterium]MDE2898376.1 hypothetical protein [Chloroflexota bacterium]MDE2962581.1 hypothetical protein [Acidobacteriota bacterium]